MTERLAQLLAAEADHLDVPIPRTADVLGRGRSLRRRHRAAQGIAGLAMVAVVGTAAVLVSQPDDGSGAIVDPAGPTRAQATADVGVVFSIGPTVYLHGGQVTATVDDVVVKSMYYTSAGVLVRHGINSYSDGGGPQRFSLVSPDGTVHRLSVTTEEVVPGVDIAQPYLAYAEVVDGTVEVVVHNVATDKEVARVTVPDATEWGGWSAPPVSLDGDHVYVGTADVTRVVDWRTGEVSEDDAIEPGFPPQVSGGRLTHSSGSTEEVLDSDSGDTLLTVDTDPDDYAYLTLSPDGRFAKLTLQGGEETSTFQVYDVDSGTAVSLDGGSYNWAWTPDGELFSLADDGRLTTCSAVTAECDDEQLDLAVLPGSAAGDENYSDDLVLGNQIRES